MTQTITNSRADGRADGLAGVGCAAEDHADEQSLIERSKSDPQAFAVLYRRHYRVVAGCIYRRTGDVHVAEDLAADTFISAYRAIGSFKTGRVPIRFWFLRIATNVVNRWSRAQRRIARHREEFATADSALEDSRTQAEIARCVREGVARLALAHQAVLSLHYFESLSIEEIAAVLGCRVGTVKSRLSRARESLKATLKERGEPHGSEP